MSTAVVVVGISLMAIAVVAAVATRLWRIRAHGPQARYQRDVLGIRRSQAATLGFGTWAAGGHDGTGSSRGDGGGSFGGGGASCGGEGGC